MATSFVFEPPSDEEVDLSEAEELEDEEEEAEREGEEEKPSKRRQKQSPWDFASYSESVAEEHARRSTTSIDDKISRVRQQHSTPLPDHTEDASSSDSEPDKQVTNYLTFCIYKGIHRFLIFYYFIFLGRVQGGR